jgi:malonate transporter
MPGSYLEPAVYALSLIVVGILVSRIKFLEALTRPAFRFLNLAILWVMLPIVVLVSIASYSRDVFLSFGSAAILGLASMGISFVLAVVISNIMKQDRKTTIAITLNSAFMNVTYLGFPLVYAMVGITGLGPASLFAVVVAVPNLALGVALASAASKGRVNARFVVENVLIFPATIALIAAMLFIGFDAILPSVVSDTFYNFLAKPFFALMLLFVGFQMPIVDPRKYKSKLATVGAIRFLASPLVTYGLMMAIGLTMRDIVSKPSLILAIMPPAVFNFFIAHNFNLDRKLYGALVFYLTIISLFVALPLMIFLVF